MTNGIQFPHIETYLPEMMSFVGEITEDYCSGNVSSWELMAERVNTFFTSEMLNTVDAVMPGWYKMSAYANGVTLTHVMCVFTGLLTSLEYRQASYAQQELMKWAVCLHDVAKKVHPGQRDNTHAFRSAALAEKILPQTGFPVTGEYSHIFEEWFTFTGTAITKKGATGPDIQDNRKLPEIIVGIERLFGFNTPAALVIKTVLLHHSVTVVKEWPQAAPLTEMELRLYLDAKLYPLLKMMMLADNDGWNLFNPSIREQYRQDTLEVFNQLAPVN